MPAPPCSAGHGHARQTQLARGREGAARKFAGLVDVGRPGPHDALGELADRGLQELLLLRELQIHGRRSIPAAGRREQAIRGTRVPRVTGS